MIPWHTVNSLGQLLEDGELDEIELETKEHRIKLNRTVQEAPAVSVDAQAASAGQETEDTSEGSSKDNWVTIDSPMVGTFYKAPAPDADPFVEVGDEVTEGTTVCIIEAMKLMNEIEADTDGVIKEVCRENAEPVSKGDDLFYVEPT